MNEIVVVGDTNTSPPFTGPVDSQVRGWLKQAGINPLLDVTYVVLSDACVGNVDFLKAKFTLALGERALHLLCPIRSMTLKHAHGHFWSTTSGVAMATYHPMSTKHNGQWGRTAAEDVELFGLVVRDDVVPAPDYLCVRCKAEPVEVVCGGMGLGQKCKRFARPVVVQGELFAMRMVDPT